MIDSAYKVTVKRNVAAGFGPVSLCYKCTSSNGHQTKTFTWTIQQVMDCNNAMVLKSQADANVPVTPMAVPWYYYSTTYVYASTYTRIFTHPDPTNCPVTGCTLMDTPACSSVFTNTNFFLASSSNPNPYVVKYKRNISMGWT